MYDIFDLIKLKEKRDDDISNRYCGNCAAFMRIGDKVYSKTLLYYES
jgi:hypothetical protein